MKRNKLLQAVIAPSLAIALSVAVNAQASGSTYPDHVHTNYGQIVTDNYGECVGLGAGEQTSVEQCGKHVAPKKAEAAPAPQPVATPVEQHKPDITLSADALFDFDKSVLKPEGKKIIDRELKKVSHASDKSIISIRVVGYTDGIGSDAYNDKLSLRRANAVKNYLVSKGIAASTIHTEGHGKSNPVASNATAAGRAKNRRAEIYFTYK